MDRENKPMPDLARDIEALYDFSEEYMSRLEKLGKRAAAQQRMPEKELVLWTAIAGLFYYVNPQSEEGGRLLESLHPGTELVLRREPDNPYDRWAIAVETKNHEKLGFVTRYKNETIARMMDYGHRFEARVENTDETEKEIPEKQRAATEQMILPFSVWLIA